MDNLEELIRRIPRRAPPKSLDARIEKLCSLESTPHFGRRVIRPSWLAVTAVAAMLVGCVLGFQLGRQVAPTAMPDQPEGKLLKVYQIELVPSESRSTRPFVFACEKRRWVVPDIATRVTVRTGDGL